MTFLIFLCGLLTGVVIRASGDEWRKAALGWQRAKRAWRIVLSDPDRDIHLHDTPRARAFRHVARCGLEHPHNGKCLCEECGEYFLDWGIKQP
jgi:hypothetical protein